LNLAGNSNRFHFKGKSGKFVTEIIVDFCDVHKKRTGQAEWAERRVPECQSMWCNTYTDTTGLEGFS
jgi:hypothetical protein